MKNTFYLAPEIALILRRFGEQISSIDAIGVAIVPGAFFSPFGGQWIRFSYATPPERTLGAIERLLEGLNALLVG